MNPVCLPWTNNKKKQPIFNQKNPKKSSILKKRELVHREFLAQIWSPKKLKRHIVIQDQKVIYVRTYSRKIWEEWAWDYTTCVVVNQLFNKDVLLVKITKPCKLRQLDHPGLFNWLQIIKSKLIIKWIVVCFEEDLWFCRDKINYKGLFKHQVWSFNQKITISHCYVYGHITVEVCLSPNYIKVWNLDVSRIWTIPSWKYHLP